MRYLALLLILLSATAWAKTYKLFTSTPNGVEMMPGYAGVVRFMLAPGDEVEFSDGSKLKLGRKLGSGGTTEIFELADAPGKALRLPDSEFNMQFITYYIRGHKSLQEAGVPVVGIHESRPKEFVVVDRLNPGSLTFEQIVGRHGAPAFESEKLEEKFLEFARRTAALSNISDFGPSQLAYDPVREEWILFDWTERHTPASGARTVFHDFFGQYRGSKSPKSLWALGLAERADRAISEHRAADPALSVRCRPGVLQRLRDRLLGEGGGK